MPLFGKKNNTNLPEVVDFSNDSWSFKGDAPTYQIQSDGFTYDVVDSDGNDKNAITLGLSGMLVIVLNAKSPKIREDEILPHLGKVIKTHNWHSMTVKEANFLVQTAIKKLTSSAASGDVFDLASYAPLEVKRVLLKTLFTISRTQMKPEFREEAEHRIIDDIVPEIFSSPDYELALLTGLIMKPDPKPAEPDKKYIETKPIIDPEMIPGSQQTDGNRPQQEAPQIRTAPVEEDSAFAELQKIYGRRSDSAEVKIAAAKAAENNPAQQAPNTPADVSGEEPKSTHPSPLSYSPEAPAVNPFAPVEPKSIPQPQASGFSGMQTGSQFSQPDQKIVSQQSAPVFSAPNPNFPPSQTDAGNIPQPGIPNFSAPQTDAGNIPQPGMTNFSVPQADAGNIPQPGMPNFSAPQPNNPFSAAENPQNNMQGNNIPQPPAPNFGMQPGPYGNMMQQGNFPPQNAGYPQGAPYMGNFPPYPGQMWQQNPQFQQNFPPQGMPQQPYPGQMWQQNQQFPQNFGQYPSNDPTTWDSDKQKGQAYPGWMNQAPNPQQPRNN